LQALLADEVKVAGGKAFIVRDGKATDAATGAAATLPDDAEDVVNNNRMRRELEAALAALKLFARPRRRDQAITDLKDSGRRRQAGADRQGHRRRDRREAEGRLELLRAAVMISSSDKAKRLAAATRWRAANSRPPSALLIESWPPSRPRSQGRHPAAARQVQSRLAWGERLGVLFTGISLGRSCCWWRWAWPSPTA
jgi:urea transport system permease protein